MTDSGFLFVERTIRVPKYAVTYANSCLRLEGPQWSMDDALGKKFNYRELMGWGDGEAA